MPLRARRLLVTLLVGAGFAALVADAAFQDIPLADSLSMTGRFWRAGPRGRLLNAPGIARDAAFAVDALRAAASWPVDEDVVLLVGPAVSPEQRERLRRKAAYLLAPRRVLLGTTTGPEPQLRPARAEGPDR